MPRRGAVRPWPELGAPPQGLSHQSRLYLAWHKQRGHSTETLRGVHDDLRLFLEWCAERSLTEANDLTPAILERYQRRLFDLRTRDGRKLAAQTQFTRLNVVRELCAFMMRSGSVKKNAAEDLALPRLSRRLPRGMLASAEVDRLLAQPDTTTADGLRDRAMLEVVYATAIRAVELVALDLRD